MKSSTGINIKSAPRFFDFFNSNYGCRYYGDDNLYPQHLQDFLQSSPSLAECVERKSVFLSNAEGYEILKKKDIETICNSYSLFGGFALLLTYNLLGDIQTVSPIPFETIRLGEKGEDGIITYCYYCADWSGVDTVNTERINPNTDKKRYYLFTDSIETRLARLGNDTNYSDIMYFSNRATYPNSPATPVMNYISSEVGIANLMYRNIRTNFTPSMVISHLRQSEETERDFEENLGRLQGDENALKIMSFSYSSIDEKPEAINLSPEDYTARCKDASEACRSSIFSAFNQTQFLRIADGSLGFGSEAIQEIFKYYNFFLASERQTLQSELNKIDPNLILEQINYA